ncbi:MAG: hypothetical protein IKP86_02920 [Anaerolineaceae bacterium]|nr:hypothetical protein [Anaerolineaceae bacterium]
MTKETNKKNQKRQETMMLIMMALILAVIILVSKFVIGINFSLMEQGNYLSFGYHEVHGARMWALEFESFTGSISSNGELPEAAERKLTVYAGTGNSPLTLTLKCGKQQEEHVLGDDPLILSIPGDKNKFTMTLSGTDVLTGYFNAVWE